MERSNLSLKTRALTALSRREYSRTELQRKLKPYAEDPETLETLLDELTNRNFLSDARFVEHVVRKRAARHGVQRIRQELRQHHLSETLIDEACATLHADESERLYALWIRRFAEKPQSFKEQAQQMRFLQNRGFSIDAIRTLFRDITRDPL